jgi:hypothetical protein
MARPNDVINEKSRSILSIFDLQNKFIAYTAPVRTIKAVFSEWGSLFTISTDLKMLQLTEKDIQSKLELLFKKNFYDVAIKYVGTFLKFKFHFFTFCMVNMKQLSFKNMDLF